MRLTRRSAGIILGWFLTAISLPGSFLGAQEALAEPAVMPFRFVHRAGDVIHADAAVEESVYLNGIYLHDALIGESSVSRVTAVDSEGAGELDAVFRTEERIDGRPGYYEWSSSEAVSYGRDPRGRMTVPDEASRPVLRNLPVFPEKPLRPGDTWTENVEEVHVFRIGNGLAGPYRSRVPAAYEYAGNTLKDGRETARFLIRYNLYLPVTSYGEPVRLISGRSEQELFWDIEAGRPESREEEFEFMLMSADGTVREFRGRQRVVYRYTRELDREAVISELQSELRGDTGITISPDPEGIRLVLEDSDFVVLFEPESAVVSSSRRSRLETLGSVLNNYPERDLLITGHTAHFGTPEGRYRLSMDRAAAVAEILFPDGRKSGGRLFLRGAGSGEPAGSDRENRRVEILILD